MSGRHRIQPAAKHTAATLSTKHQSYGLIAFVASIFVFGGMAAALGEVAIEPEMAPVMAIPELITPSPQFSEDYLTPATPITAVPNVSPITTTLAALPVIPHMATAFPHSLAVPMVTPVAMAAPMAKPKAVKATKPKATKTPQKPAKKPSGQPTTEPSPPASAPSPEPEQTPDSTGGQTQTEQPQPIKDLVAKLKEKSA